MAASVPKPDPTAQAKEFFADPIGTIRRELADSVKPLMDFTKTVKDESEYGKLKTQFKSDTRFKDFLSDPTVEATIDKLMEGNPPTPQALYSVILSVKGAQEFGEMPKPTSPKPGEPAKVPDVTVPPHMRPSSPPGVLEDPSKKKEETRELTENETRLCKETGMTKEEYLRWLEEEAEGVPTSKIGVKEPTKK
jgi:hypothetical protein